MAQVLQSLALIVQHLDGPWTLRALKTLVDLPFLSLLLKGKSSRSSRCLRAVRGFGLPNAA